MRRSAIPSYSPRSSLASLSPVTQRSAVASTVAETVSSPGQATTTNMTIAVSSAKLSRPDGDYLLAAKMPTLGTFSLPTRTVGTTSSIRTTSNNQGTVEGSERSVPPPVDIGNDRTLSDVAEGKVNPSGRSTTTCKSGGGVGGSGTSISDDDMADTDENVSLRRVHHPHHQEER